MLASLGQFVFGLPTLAYQELQRRTAWKHPTTSRVGARDASQYAGPGEDTITLTGLLAPQLTGTLASLVELRAMADTGHAYVLVDGAGRVYGAYVIESIDEGQSMHQADGVPRRVEFTINLRRTEDREAISHIRKASNEADA
jgi:phage protein U